MAVQDVSEYGMQNGQGRYLVHAKTPYVNQFVVQLGNENLHASSFDERKLGFSSYRQYLMPKHEVDVNTNTIVWRMQ